jgi:hypothetical protein
MTKLRSKKLKDFRFSLGDSHQGEVGLCFSIKANSQNEAVKLAREAFKDIEEQGQDIKAQVPNEAILFCAVYVRPESITKDHIVDIS